MPFSVDIMLRRYPVLGNAMARDVLKLDPPPALPVVPDLEDICHQTVAVNPEGSIQGVIFRHGYRFGGYTLFVQDEKLQFVY